MSSWTLLVVSLISIVVLGMFFGGGITNPGEEMKEYVYTGLLLNWTSALFFVTIICMVLFAVWQFITLLKVNPKSALSALGVVVAFVAMLFITYSIGDGTPLQGLNADSQKYNTAGWYGYVDQFFHSFNGLDHHSCSSRKRKENAEQIISNNESIKQKAIWQEKREKCLQ